MKAYIGIKFHSDCRNRSVIERLSAVLESRGYTTFCTIRDKEKWGTEKFTPQELMEATCTEISSSSLVVLDLSEKGVGLGIEAGYAHAKGIPVITVAKHGSDIPNTLLGISEQVVMYDQPEDLKIIL